MIVPPIDPIAEIEAGRQAELTVITNIADPVAVAYTGFIGDPRLHGQSRDLSHRGGGGPGLRDHDRRTRSSNVPPEVIASPTKPVLVNLAPVAPSIVGFYGLAALALVLQHMAVTLIALSIVRERQSGSLDRFRPRRCGPTRS